jgi:transglutaminase/protease-like cytokinesis protein 3
MDGVIEQLDALGVRETESPEPVFDPWSPESFDMVNQNSRRKHQQGRRPQTAMGISQHTDEGYETFSGSGESSRGDPTADSGYREDQQQPPQLSNYVERMESRLRQMHAQQPSQPTDMRPPAPPPKGGRFERPKSSMDNHQEAERKMRHKRSAYEMGRQALGRTFTTKTNSTNSSNATDSTNRSLMSGMSASGISATSAGSLARKQQTRAQSALGVRDLDADRPGTPFTGITYHSSHASGDSRPKSQAGYNDDPLVGLGGLVQPGKARKQNFIKRILESAKTGVASTRGQIAMAGVGSVQSSPVSRSTIPRPLGMTGIAGGLANGSTVSLSGRDAAREMGLASGVDWVQVRRDVNRSNSLSRIERNERRDRCQILDFPALDPVDELYSSVTGNEGADGMPVRSPTDYQSINLSQVDKNSRFIVSLPPMTTAITLATTYVCRPYRSDVQRLRAIFTWAAEKICWEEDFEGAVDTRRVIQTKKACSQEYAVLVSEMCAAVGLHCEIIRGYLKTPGEVPETGMMPAANHWWNAVVVDEEWRIMDSCLASPSNPRRSLYSSAANSTADFWWFLASPLEICWTHIPDHHSHQHICPPVAHEILLNLPAACPPFFRNGLAMVDYNSSLTRIEDLEMMHVKFNVPADVEVAAEVEVRSYSRDSDGDFFESGEVVKKRALAQAEWFGGCKRYTVKALLPGDEGTGILKVYAGKKGLMHSIKDIPHPLAFALPIIHEGENPPYDFFSRHPTPHAQRHDIYVVQPQCQRLALNNTFVFAIRQHPSSLGPAGSNSGGSVMTPSSNPGGTSPVPFVRPSSAMSMTSSNPSTSSSSASGTKKPAKLAIQTPGGKILRLMRKEEKRGGTVGVGSRSAGAGGEEEVGDGGTWETIIKCSERGVWRGLVLADRTARWCVFAEWVCVG